MGVKTRENKPADLSILVAVNALEFTNLTEGHVTALNGKLFKTYRMRGSIST